LEGTATLANPVLDKVRPLALRAAEQNDVELWDVEFAREGAGWILRVTIDRPDGIDMDACEAVSRTLDPLLDKSDPIPQSYTLEVSSAGVERVLRNESDYQRYLGEYVEVRLFAAQNGQKEFFGHLYSFDDETLSLSEGQTFQRKNISQIRLRLKI